jgi:GNAT superfamily N-acetyltransferase
VSGAERALLDRVVDTLNGYFALGHEVVDTALARFVHDRAHPDVYDANHASSVRAATPDEVASLLGEADERFAYTMHRTFKVDPRTPPAFEAALVLAGYECDTELQSVLEGELAVTPRTVDIRTVETDDDWSSLLRLTRADHEEEARKEAREPWPHALTEALVAAKRVKPGLRWFLARVEGVDCAFFSSWPGTNGVGKVEDLFTDPGFRHRGVATALIAHAVHDARERGAGPVLIGAVAADTPKAMYAALGFRPCCVYRSYTRKPT